jgi:hypothetical protein
MKNGYLAGGCIAQTVWNYIFDKEIDYGIDDFDIVYFDDVDITENCEEQFYVYLNNSLNDFPYKIDVKNEARVHLWYKERFGKEIKPYTSTEDAISSWPSTATSIGVKYEDSEFKVYTPFDLDDLYSGIVRPNKKLISKEVYDNKASKWHCKWNELTVVKW